MIDAGPPKKINAFRRKLSRLYIPPGEIKLIVLTHSHFDHAGSSRDIQDLTGARVLIHELEKDALKEESLSELKGNTTWGKIVLKLLLVFFRKVSFPLPRIDIITGNEDMPLFEFGVDGYVIHTPGHTKGSVSVLLTTGEAFVGCMAHAGFPLRSTPGLPVFAEDINLLKESWKKIIDRGARIIFPSHGSPFPVDIIRKKLNNPSFA
jgi:glyoxylase-like metal-dependent hydrolase (beta-lactamase superfamily II)